MKTWPSLAWLAEARRQNALREWLAAQPSLAAEVLPLYLRVQALTCQAFSCLPCPSPAEQQGQPGG